MATDVERLVVSLEASITKYERAMNKAMGQTNKTMRNIERRADQTAVRVESRLSRMGRGISTSFAAIQRAWVGAFAGIAAMRGAQQLIDASTRIENSLKVAGLAGDELTRVYDSLYASAQRNAAPLEALTELYGRAALVQNELGITTQELLGFTDKIAVALRVSGKSAAESSGALLQLSQALGSGIVRAEEFNSILEGALPIAQAAAAGLEEAGGSVAKLRQLVVDGKVSSEAFFRAFEAGSSILTDKVANAELTVSQQFIRLMNVLTDTAGKFNDATGAGDAMGSAIAGLAGEIEDFGNFLDQHGESVRAFFSGIANALEAIETHGGFFADLMGRGEWNAFGYLANLWGAIEDAGDRASESVSAAAAEVEMLEGQLRETAALAQEYVDILLNSRDFDLYPEAVQNQLLALSEDLEDGRIDAEDTLDSLNALGEANPNFAPLIERLSGVVSALLGVQRQADSTAQSIASSMAAADAFASNKGRGRPWREGEIGGPDIPVRAPVPPARPDGLGGGSAANTISLADYPVGGVPGSGPGSGGGGGGSANAYQQAIAAREKAIQQLQMEAALTRQATIANNDFGYSVERLRAQMELENAAIEAGIALTPERRAEIEKLADSYALVSANATRLAEAQDKVRETAEAMGAAGRDALDTIIQGFIDGKDAGEIFGQALRQLGSALINMGLNGIGTAFNIPGFANGTQNAPGGLAIVGERGRELVNLPKGAQVIPNYRTNQMLSGSGGASFTFAPVIDARGADIAAVARLEQVVARQQVEFEGRVKQIVKGRGTKWR